MGEIVVKQTDTHDTPSTGNQSLYPKTDNVWYTKLDDGTEQPLLSNQEGQVVIVAKSGGDYTTISAALASITDNSTSKRYTVLIYPGTYVENVTMKEYVSLRGVGGPSEVIIYGVNSNPLVTFDSGASESGLYSLTLTMAPTVATGNMISCDSGLHIIQTCYMVVSSSTGGAACSIADVTGGRLIMNSSVISYAMTGTSVGAVNHRLLKSSSTGRLSFNDSDLSVDIADLDDNFTFMYSSTAPIVATEHGSIDSATMHITMSNASYSGTCNLFEGYGALTYYVVSNNHIYLGSAGNGTGYCYNINSTSGTAIMNSISNSIEVTGFTSNYYANIDTGDTLMSAFDSLSAAESETGAGTIAYTHSQASGDFHISSDIVLKEQSSSGTPISGNAKIYAKTDGKVYSKDDAGTEYDLTAGQALDRYRDFYIDASAFTPRETNGAQADTEELATNDIMNEQYLFDGSTSEAIQFKMTMPDDWNLSTIKAKIYWDGSSGASPSDGVVWGVRARAVGNDDAIDGSWGTEITVSDTLIALGDMHVTAATSAITVGNTPALGDMIYFEVTRKPADGSDTMSEDAKFFGMSIQYVEDADGASQW